MGGVKFAPLVIVAVLAALGGFLLGSRGVGGSSGGVSPVVSDPAAVYRRANPAVLTVRSSNAQLNSFDARGIGTAFHIGGGYYVTAAHVVSDGYQFYLDGSARTVARLQDNAGLTKVSVVGADTISDIAVLKGNPAPATLSWSAKDAGVGDTAFALGNPFALAPNSFSAGIISGSNRVFGTDRGTLTGMLQMDTPVNPGNSGGPLLNSAGEVIGVVSAIYAPSNQSAGVGFAVPSSKAQGVVEALKNGGKVVHPSLGVIGGGSQARIAALQPGGSAAQSDLREGDLILKVGGLEIESFEELTALVANANPGEDLKLLVKRGSETKTITVKLLAQ